MGKKVKKINTKKKFVADGVFQAELNEFLCRTLGMEGYAGIEVRATSMSTEIRVRAAKCQDLLNKSARKVKEIKSLIEKRYNLLGGTPVRLAANNILGTVMRRGGAVGCEVRVSGKVRGQRAKAQKYTQGYQISTGQPKNDFIDSATRSVELRQGVIGLKVLIMQGTEIKQGNTTKIMPDYVKILEPKDEDMNAITPGVVTFRDQGQGEAADPTQQ